MCVVVVGGIGGAEVIGRQDHVDVRFLIPEYSMAENETID